MSHLIKNLEDEMGVKLLNRSGKKVIPTPAGWLFYNKRKRYSKLIKHWEMISINLLRRLRGLFNIGASTTVATYLLPQVLYDFSRRYPEVQINLTVSNTEAIINELQQGNSDLGIVEGNIENKGLL